MGDMLPHNLHALRSAMSRLLTARTVRSLLIPASGVVLFASLLLAAVPYYADKPIESRNAAISDFASPGENPHGYLIATAGIVLCALLLMPAALCFFRVLREPHRRAAAVGSLLFWAGLAGGVVLACMSPFQDGFSAVHIYLAYSIFTLTAAGLWMLLMAATRQTRRNGGGQMMLAATILQACVLTYLLALLANQIFNSGTHVFAEAPFYRSVAFCEWVLCLESMVCLFVLASGVKDVEEAIG